MRDFKLTKAEVLMIANLRPTKPESLNTIVEEFETRFPEEEVQQKIVDVIIEALGSPDGSAERQAMVGFSSLLSIWHTFKSQKI